jgi:hypothetical protein
MFSPFVTISKRSGNGRTKRNAHTKRVRRLLHQAGIAQLVEQRTENPRVGGSSPPPGIYNLLTSLTEKIMLIIWLVV